MKTIIALLGGLGVLLIAAPTAHATVITPFANCTEAYANGWSLIPQDDPHYSPKLDWDSDGYACENPPEGFKPRVTTTSRPATTTSTVPASTTTTTTIVVADPVEAHEEIEEAPVPVRVTPTYTG